MQNRNRKQQRRQQRFYSCFAIWSTHDRRISYMYIHLAFNEANRKECKCLFGMETATKIEKERRKEYKCNKNLYEISTWMLKQSAIINAFSWLVSLSKREYIGIKPSTMKIKANISSLRNAKNNETKANWHSIEQRHRREMNLHDKKMMAMTITTAATAAASWRYSRQTVKLSFEMAENEQQSNV